MLDLSALERVEGDSSRTSQSEYRGPCDSPFGLPVAVQIRSWRIWRTEGFLSSPPNTTNKKTDL